MRHPVVVKKRLPRAVVQRFFLNQGHFGNAEIVVSPWSLSSEARSMSIWFAIMKKKIEHLQVSMSGSSEIVTFIVILSRRVKGILVYKINGRDTWRLKKPTNFCSDITGHKFLRHMYYAWGGAAVDISMISGVALPTWAQPHYLQGLRRRRRSGHDCCTHTTSDWSLLSLSSRHCTATTSPRWTIIHYRLYHTCSVHQRLWPPRHHPRRVSRWQISCSQ